MYNLINCNLVFLQFVEDVFRDKGDVDVDLSCFLLVKGTFLPIVHEIE